MKAKKSNHFDLNWFVASAIMILLRNYKENSTGYAEVHYFFMQSGRVTRYCNSRASTEQARATNYIKNILYLLSQQKKEGRKKHLNLKTKKKKTFFYYFCITCTVLHLLMYCIFLRHIVIKFFQRTSFFFLNINIIYIIYYYINIYIIYILYIIYI